jgi:hypothetical protein
MKASRIDAPVRHVAKRLWPVPPVVARWPGIAQFQGPGPIDESGRAVAIDPILHVQASIRKELNRSAATADLVADLDRGGIFVVDPAESYRETHLRAAVDLVVNRYAAAGTEIDDAVFPGEAPAVDLVEQVDGAAGAGIHVTVPVDLSLSAVVAGLADADVAGRRQRHPAVVIDLSTDGDGS